MGERDLEQRIERLEERLARIEARLGMASPRALTPEIAPAPVPAPVATSLPEHVPLATPVIPMPAPRSAVMPPPLPKSTSAKPQPAKRAAAGAFETQVGLKWAAWVGAIVVVIGAALGIKFAYDQHWFEALPAAARLALMSLGGFALVGAGEVVYRRVGALASAGLFGAGVATLFVVSYAGHEYFNLYERDAAFALMGLVTLLGAAVAIRADLVSVGVLSVVGGNVAPLVLGGDSHRLAPLLTYLLALQVVSLSLAWWGRTPKWWTLRGVSLATICLWMLVPVLNVDELTRANLTTAIVFTLLYATLFHAELVLSSLRPSKPTRTRRPDFTVPVPLGARGVLEDRRGIGVTFSLFVTAATTIAILAFVWDQPSLVRGAWTAGLGVSCLLLGLLLSRVATKRDADVTGPPSPIPALSTGYRIQAAALLVVAIPVTLSGVWVTLAWAVLALAFATAGAVLNLGVSRVAAMLVWMLAVANLGLWTLGAAIGGGGGGPGGPMMTWTSVLGQPIPAYLGLAALMAVVGHVVAAFVREDWSAASAARQALAVAEAAGQSEAADAHGAAEPSASNSLNLEYERRASHVARPLAGRGFQALGAIADALAVLAFVAAAFAALPPLGVTFALLAYGWVLVAAGQVARSPELRPAGVLLIALSAGKWLFADTLNQLLNGPTAPPVYRPLFNPAAALGAALVLSGLAMFVVPMRNWTERRVLALRAAGGFVAILMLLWLVTLEIGRWYAVRVDAVRGTPAADDYVRAAQVTISVFWSVYAIACVALGFAVRVAGVRYFGLALFALTLVKVVFVDLSTVSTGYRILSFLGLGLLLLGTSVLYGKLSPVLLRDQSPAEPMGGQT